MARPDEAAAGLLDQVFGGMSSSLRRGGGMLGNFAANFLDAIAGAIKDSKSKEMDSAAEQLSLDFGDKMSEAAKKKSAAFSSSFVDSIFSKLPGGLKSSRILKGFHGFLGNLEKGIKLVAAKAGGSFAAIGGSAIKFIGLARTVLTRLLPVVIGIVSSFAAAMNMFRNLKTISLENGIDAMDRLYRSVTASSIALNMAQKDVIGLYEAFSSLGLIARRSNDELEAMVMTAGTWSKYLGFSKDEAAGLVAELSYLGIEGKESNAIMKDLYEVSTAYGLSLHDIQDNLRMSTKNMRTLMMAGSEAFITLLAQNSKLKASYKNLGLSTKEAEGWMEKFGTAASDGFAEVAAYMSSFTGKDIYTIFEEAGTAASVLDRNTALLNASFARLGDSMFKPGLTSSLVFKDIAKNLGMTEKDARNFVFSNKKLFNDLTKSGMSSADAIKEIRRQLNDPVIIEQGALWDERVSAVESDLGSVLSSLKNIGVGLLVEIGKPILDIIQPALAGVAGFLKKSPAALKIISGAVVALGIAITIAFLPILKIPLIIMGIIWAVKKLYDEFEFVRYVVDGVWKGIKYVFDLVGKAVVGVGATITALLSSIVSVIAKPFEWVYGKLEDFFTWLNDKFDNPVFRFFMKFFGETKKMTAVVSKEASSFSKYAFGFAKDLFSDIGSGLEDNIAKGADKLENAGNKVSVSVSKASTSLSNVKVTSQGNLVSQISSVKPRTLQEAVSPNNVIAASINKDLLASKKMEDRFMALKDTIGTSANVVGVDPNLLAQVAAFESRFRTTVKAPGSSAYGIGQFTNDTWVQTLKKSGANWGLGDLSKLSKDELLSSRYRDDPRLQSLALAQFTKSNLANLSDKGVSSGNQLLDVYAAHNLGEWGGEKFLRALTNNPNANVREALAGSDATKSKIISGNPSLYGDGNLTVAQAAQNMMKQLEGYSQFSGRYDSEDIQKANETMLAESERQTELSRGIKESLDGILAAVRQNANTQEQALQLSYLNQDDTVFANNRNGVM
jgi:hypothetical protein